MCLGSGSSSPSSSFRSRVEARRENPTPVAKASAKAVEKPSLTLAKVVANKNSLSGVQRVLREAGYL